MELVATGWCTRKCLSFDKTIRNFTSGDLGILLVAIQLRVTRLKKKIGRMGSMILVSQGLVLFQGMDVQFKGKYMLHYSRGVKQQQGFTTGAAFFVYNVRSFTFEMLHDGLVVIMPEILINSQEESI